MKTLLSVLAATTLLAGVAQAQEIKEFNIGILGGENAQDRLTSQECYRAAIEASLGVPVKLFTPADYDGVIQGLLGGTLDMAWLGASAYAKIFLTDPASVDLALTKQNLDGSTGYYSIGFARKDSGITTIEEAKGKVFAFAEPNSTSGYLVPGAEMTAAFGPLDQFFSEVKFSGGHEQTIVGVANGDFAAGVSWADGLGNWEDGYNSGAFRRAFKRIRGGGQLDFEAENLGGRGEVTERAVATTTATDERDFHFLAASRGVLGENGTC